ncbi:MAG: hypothetical protein KZQ63_09895 [Candidatus Thiodiazotropha sp. (ex Lucinoma aequizonata)]|nr:hypothetical protein [Candidatus Thiodiazotropha sp. (ex Lucinoma aequizonata)]
MRSLYALHLSLSVVIPPIQPHLRLSGTNRLRSAFHGGQRLRRFAIGLLKSKKSNKTIPKMMKKLLLNYEGSL